MSDQPPRIRPKPFNTPPRGFWRATPPAIFPPILGLFGLGLAWRQAGHVLGAPVWIGEMMLGAVSLLYLFALVSYGAKLARRFGALLDDARILPGRAGLSAMSASGFLLAATLASYDAVLAQAVLFVALAAHAVVAVTIVLAMARGPAEQRRVTPVWHLSFAGFIIAPVAAVPLGWVGLSAAIFATTLPVAAAIWIVSALQFARADVPPPLRPLLAIHMAPVALFGIVAALLGYERLALGFGWLGITGLAVCLLGIRYLTRADFSALYGAFTFPLAAFAALMFALAPAGGAVFRILGGLELAAATLAIAYIAAKVMQLWAKGRLATATNAATA
ncbi:tellurium resistance protein [Celeribacter indicus]|uniref:Tellurite resistance protein n=1 Tax=Celeribacter indicus TaxID=1208324 RepID=A0A0B5E0G6_9RHOB|nr:tellurium resistance protein [Celeribacter indicus]AJE46910.1 tellurite resistance protein [Celeribacter indicus]SDW78858.1 tellurite resistance protein [Celeribacter indicus]